MAKYVNVWVILIEGQNNQFIHVFFETLNNLASFQVNNSTFVMDPKWVCITRSMNRARLFVAGDHTYTSFKTNSWLPRACTGVEVSVSHEDVPQWAAEWQSQPLCHTPPRPWSPFLQIVQEAVGEMTGKALLCWYTCNYFTEMGSIDKLSCMLYI